MLLNLIALIDEINIIMLLAYPIWKTQFRRPYILSRAHKSAHSSNMDNSRNEKAELVYSGEVTLS